MSDISTDENGKVWKWAIEPSPYDRHCRFLTDDDDEALEAIVYAGEFYLWDDNDGGATRTLKVTHRPEVPTRKSNEIL